MCNFHEVTFSWFWLGWRSISFQWIFKEDYSQDSDEGYFPAVDAKYEVQSYKLHNDSKSLPKRTKIRKVEKLSGSLYDIKDYVIHIRELKQALKYGLVFKSA